MFADVMDAFEERVREIELFCDLLVAVEFDAVAYVDEGGTQIQPVPQDWGPMLKGSLYLVLYNLVEAFIRKGFEEVFQAIKSDQLCGIELTATLRNQWIVQKNRVVKPLDGSPNVYMKIANSIVDEIAKKTVAALRKDLLPYGGTLDAEKIRKLCHAHGVPMAVDSAALGGAALVTVKSKRNNLAHGDESFAECGRQVTAADLIKATSEIVLFMRGVLSSLETFTNGKQYRDSGVAL